MRVLITGATGFIGCRLAQRCAGESMGVVALGRRSGAVEQERAEVLAARGLEVSDIPVEDRAGLEAAMEGIDVVFHLAAAQHEAGVPDEYFRSINVEGTRNVFEAATTAGVGRVVHGSTIGVYGSHGRIVGEASPLEPDNIYGLTKLEGEAVVRSFQGRIPFAIARISETYGPGDRRLLKLFRGAERGLDLLIGSGRNLHHLVYIDDLLEGLLLAAREDAALGRIFVLAGLEPATTREMLEAVARSLGREPRIVRVPLAPLLGAAVACEGLLSPLGIRPPLHRRRMDFFRKSFSFSIDEAARFGFKPRVGLSEGMDATARWYEDQGLLGRRSEGN